MKEVVAKEAWGILSSDATSVLVDVRTPAEWAQIGLPVLEEQNPAVICISWQPGLDEHFLTLLKENVPSLRTPLLFLCRSGMRSHHAAALALNAGYDNVSNIVDGFEDKHGPGTGWRAGGLPWAYKPLSGS